MFPFSVWSWLQIYWYTITYIMHLNMYEMMYIHYVCSFVDFHNKDVNWSPWINIWRNLDRGNFCEYYISKLEIILFLTICQVRFLKMCFLNTFYFGLGIFFFLIQKPFWSGLTFVWIIPGWQFNEQHQHENVKYFKNVGVCRTECYGWVKSILIFLKLSISHSECYILPYSVH